MTLVSNFTLDGVTDISLGIELLPDHQEPLLPGTRDRYVEIPGRAGSWEFTGDLEARRLVLACSAMSTTRVGLAAVIRTLTTALLDSDGRPKDIALIYLKEPTKTYTVRYAGSISIERLVGGTVGYFALPFTASDPYAYGSEDTDTASITAAYQEMAVVNAGAFKTPATITITNNGLTDITGLSLICRQIK